MHETIFLLLFLGIVMKESAEILKVAAGQRKGKKAEKSRLLS